jgi:DNA polymerase-3 subunit delta'
MSGAAAGSPLELIPTIARCYPRFCVPGGEDDAPPSERKPSQFISIDDVRNLHDFINLTARGDAGKTIVFFPAETLNVNAANALLKSLEEPPPATRFILVSHRPGYLPPTVLSRCSSSRCRRHLLLQRSNGCGSRAQTIPH